MGAVLGPVPACWAKCRGVDAGTCKRTFYHGSVPVTIGRGSGQHIARAKLLPPFTPFLGWGGSLPVPQNAHQPAYGTAPCRTAITDCSTAKKKKDPYRIEREITPLAAAPATERSERVGEEAEEALRQALCTYAPVPVPACVLFIGCAVFTHLCGFLLLTWSTFHPLCTDAK